MRLSCMMTFQAFKWLFETFLTTHNGQQPKTFYTDQDATMDGVPVADPFSDYSGKYTDDNWNVLDEEC